jgi:hypothetical protein
MNREELIDELKADAEMIRSIYGIEGSKTLTLVQGEAWEAIAERIDLAVGELEDGSDS